MVRVREVVAVGNKYRRCQVELGMTHTNTFLNGRDLLALITEQDRARRRERVEQGRSPAQHTTRSTNKARVAKHPGKGNRSAQARRAIREF